eukprot:CAMPEP_0182543398 /NCGR_PEP_ID=MMETSP1323-20130603/31593_1 /TAXON_ID=236787 /ORGANISM="Florenciella parvula, Strain RCC1693" /LENGTH=284 /DNA_ID=CAMNT_0024754333 /DNA_START=45 /DNA_END=899 /DNA_ORIENTATION=-
MPKIGGFEEPEILSSEGSWQITGKINGMVNIKLEPGEACCGEVGSMEYFQEGVKMDTTLSGKGIFAAASSWASGESPFRMVFTNEADTTLYVGLTPNQPLGNIIPIKLTEHTGNIVNAKLGAYMGSMGKDIKTTVDFKRPSCASCCACICGGPSPMIQRISTANEAEDTAFLTAMGTIVKRRIAAGEKIKVDTDALVAYEDSIQFDATRTGDCSPKGCCLVCCGGEGLWLTTLTGKDDTDGGFVWLQSYNMDKLDSLLVTERQENEGGDGGGGGAPIEASEMER